MVVMVITLQVLCKLPDTLREDSDLNLGRTGIPGLCSILFDNLCFLFLRYHLRLLFLYGIIIPDEPFTGQTVIYSRHHDPLSKGFFLNNPLILTYKSN